jgi:hypothetical protein
MTTVSLPALTSVGSNAFRSWTTLTTITLPATVTSIAANAFTDCFNLVSVTIEREATPLTTVTATSFNNTAAGLKIYVPAVSLDAYKAANVWSTTYVNKLEATPNI